MSKMQPQHVANYFLKRANDEGLEICHLKLQKLVYIAFGWVKAILDEDLFNEPIEAWKHGPVIPTLYHEFKRFRDSPITEYSCYLDEKEELVIYQLPKMHEDLKFLLGFVWDVYKRFSASTLRKMTHKKGTPWHEFYKPGAMGIEINKDLIASHFDSLIERNLRESRNKTKQAG